MRFILEQLIECLENNEPVVIGAVIRSSGSVPRSSGARMLVKSDGSLLGTVGGGAVEGKCHEAARELLHSEANHITKDFIMTANDAADAGMVCGGSVSVLLQKMQPDKLEMLKTLHSKYIAAERPVLLTELPTEDAPVVMTLFDEMSSTNFSPDNCAAIAQKKRRDPFLLLEDGREFFVEPLVHPGIVHLVGAGHVARATAKLASFAGFETVVMDDRDEFANKERFPDAREVKVLENFENCLVNLGPGDFVVIVTRGHMHDRDVLAQALQTDAGYIGMIGSSKKRKAVYDSLLKSGYSEEDLKRVYSPIGLSIGADTPEEIGISIVAELVQVRAEGTR